MFGIMHFPILREKILREKILRERTDRKRKKRANPNWLAQSVINVVVSVLEEIQAARSQCHSVEQTFCCLQNVSSYMNSSKEHTLSVIKLHGGCLIFYKFH